MKVSVSMDRARLVYDRVCIALDELGVIREEGLATAMSSMALLLRAQAASPQEAREWASVIPAIHSTLDGDLAINEEARGIRAVKPLGENDDDEGGETVH